MFERIYLINLKRRTDRLANFRRMQQEHGWQLPDPIVFEALDGSILPMPNFFQQGSGAFACARSHITCLERCLMDGVNTVLMLEDDVTFFAGYHERLQAFLQAVPTWDQLMLGGQHLHPARAITPTIDKVYNAQRTHAYALKGKAIKSLLKLWYTTSVHIDWVMGNEWQRDKAVFAPNPFIFGQAAGKSDISGRTNETKFWIPPKDTPVIFLTCPPDVAKALRGHGFHMGYSRDEHDLDKGLSDIAKLPGLAPNLKRWLDTIQWEVASNEGTVATIFHPEIPLDVVKLVSTQVIEVKGNTVQECLEQVKHLKLKPNRSASHVLVLHSTRDVVENLGGFHRGYWLDNVTGQDNGAREIGVSKNPVPKIIAWLDVVGKEAEKLNAVPLLWADGIRAEDVRQATNRTVIEIKAFSVQEVMTQWTHQISV